MSAEATNIQPSREQSIDPRASSYLLALLSLANGADHFRKGRFTKGIVSASLAAVVTESTLKQRREPNQDQNRIDPLVPSYILALVSFANSVDHFRRGRYTEGIMSMSFAAVISDSALSHRYGENYSSTKRFLSTALSRTLGRGINNASGYASRQISRRWGL